MSRLAFLAFSLLLGLSGCASAPVMYSAGKSMENISDRELINHVAKHKTFTDSIIYSSKRGRDEVRTVMDELQKRNPNWAWSEIRAGKIKLGMNEHEVKLAWGIPTLINRASYGDQWIYRRGSYTAQYLYFKRGILTGFN